MTDTDIRTCSTDTLLRLIRKDPLCLIYGHGDWIKLGAKHLVVLDQALVHTDQSRDIAVTRVKVHARPAEGKEPFTFLLDIPHRDWIKLAKPF